MFKKLTDNQGAKIVVNTDHIVMARQVKASSAKTEITLNVAAVELVGTSDGAANEFLPMTILVAEDIDQIFP